MTNQNKMREQFEEECAEWEMDTSRDSEGDYVDRQTRRGWNLWQAATAYAGAATPKAAQGGVGGRLHQIAEPAGDELPESVIDAVAEALGDAYDCGRVWNAWGYGAMGPDDFSVVAEDAERVAEIARAAINADRAMRAQAAPVAVAVPSYPSITLDFKQAAELLELAAKAAGYEYAKHGGYIVVDGIPGNWDPLTDDGDALRLAVVLKIDIHQRVSEPRVAAIAAMHSPQIERVPNESQRLALTRRAIVRAAAAIGEKMP